MKEAAGEANMTVITIVLIGLVAAAGAVFIPRLIENMKVRSCCTDTLAGTWKDGRCDFINPQDGKQTTRTFSELKKNWRPTCELDK